MGNLGEELNMENLEEEREKNAVAGEGCGCGNCSCGQGLNIETLQKEIVTEMDGVS
jgi:hypothetical protein